MKRIRSLTALGLTVALCCSLLAGCGQKEETNGLFYEAAGIPLNSTMLTVNGDAVSAQDYLYWLAYSCDYVAGMTADGSIDWTATSTSGEHSMLDAIRMDTLEAVKLHSVMSQKTAEYQLGLTEAQNAELDAMEDYYIDYFGSEDAYDKVLYDSGLTRDGFRAINRSYYEYENLLSGLFLAEDAPMRLTTAQLDQEADTYGYAHAKHILLPTMDLTTRQPLSKEEIAANKALAKDIVAQLEASEDPLTLFDELMHQYSKDSGLTSKPDGYQFTKGEMVTEFYEGALALEINEISGIVESDYGYHILLRLPMDYSDAELLRTLSTPFLEQQLLTWRTQAKVETTALYDELDVPAFYAKLTELRAANAAADLPTEGEGADDPAPAA